MDIGRITPPYQYEGDQTSGQGLTADTLGKSEFLKLLLAQIQYQDPMSPLDNYEFTSQMTQFSQLEQMFNMNDSLTTLALFESAQTTAQAVSFIGREIKALGNTLQLKEGVPDTIKFNLPEDAKEVIIQITNEDGMPVRRIELGKRNGGEQEYIWDGKNDTGSPCPDGTYSFTVEATGFNDESIDVSTYINGRVDSVGFENGIVYLYIGDTKITMSDVIHISE